MAPLRPCSRLGEPTGRIPPRRRCKGSDGRFYGTTFRGGAVGAGSVFAMTAEGALTTLYSFTAKSDGGYPSGELVQGADGSLYGTTTAGGPTDCGTVFRITPLRRIHQSALLQWRGRQVPCRGAGAGLRWQFLWPDLRGRRQRQGRCIQDHSSRRLHAALLVYRRRRRLFAGRCAGGRLRLQFLWRDQAQHLERLRAVWDGIQDYPQWRADHPAHLR